jgi:hypothetical protein
MWNNGGNGNFTSPIGQEGVVKSTTIAEVKAHGSTEDSPLFHVMNKIMSKFDELEERIFGAPIVTLPHAAHTGESASAFSQLNMRGRFTTILINMADLFMIINPNWPLWHLKPIGPIPEGLALNFLLRGRIILINMVGWF